MSDERKGFFRIRETTAKDREVKASNFSNAKRLALRSRSEGAVVYVESLDGQRLAVYDGERWYDYRLE